MKKSSPTAVKLLYFFIFFILLPGKNLAQDIASLWRIEKVRSTYTRKGPNDNFALPNYLKGKIIKKVGDCIIINKLKLFDSDLSFIVDSKDTMFFQKTNIFLIKCNAKEYDMYPGDELSLCGRTSNDTCYIGKTFLRKIGIINTEQMISYYSQGDKNKSRNCFLFVLKGQNRMVLYSGNDLLLIFFVKY